MKKWRLWLNLLGIAPIASCGPADLTYTSPAGTVDNKSAFSTKSDRVFQPTLDITASSDEPNLQNAADMLIGQHIAEFVANRANYSVFRNESINIFFPAASASTSPGLCQSRSFYFVTQLEKPGGKNAVNKGWGTPIYGIAGSVAPLSQPWSAAYRLRLTKACASRRDLGSWFEADSPADAYLAARLVDAVVAEARGPNNLGFPLRCVPFPQDWNGPPPQCENDVRKTVSAINPRTITEINPCLDKKRSHCIEAMLAKDLSSANIKENTWLFEINFTQKNDVLRIQSVNIIDSYRIFE